MPTIMLTERTKAMRFKVSQAAALFVLVGTMFLVWDGHVHGNLDGVTQVVLAKHRQSCSAACEAVGLTCSESGLRVISSDLRSCMWAVDSMHLMYTHEGSFQESGGCVYGDWGNAGGRWVQTGELAQADGTPNALATCHDTYSDATRRKVCPCGGEMPAGGLQQVVYDPSLSHSQTSATALPKQKTLNGLHERGDNSATGKAPFLIKKQQVKKKDPLLDDANVDDALDSFDADIDAEARKEANEATGNDVEAAGKADMAAADKEDEGADEEPTATTPLKKLLLQKKLAHKKGLAIGAEPAGGGPRGGGVARLGASDMGKANRDDTEADEKGDEEDSEAQDSPPQLKKGVVIDTDDEGNAVTMEEDTDEEEEAEAGSSRTQDGGGAVQEANPPTTVDQKEEEKAEEEEEEAEEENEQAEEQVEEQVEEQAEEAEEVDGT